MYVPQIDERALFLPLEWAGDRAPQPFGPLSPMSLQDVQKGEGLPRDFRLQRGIVDIVKWGGGGRRSKLRKLAASTGRDEERQDDEQEHPSVHERP